MTVKLPELVRQIQGSIVVTEGLIAELEMFDDTLDTPLWGEIQKQLIQLRDSYEAAIDIIEAVKLGEIQATERNEIIDQITKVAADQVRENLENVSLTELFHLAKINVGVTFDSDTVH